LVLQYCIRPKAAFIWSLAALENSDVDEVMHYL
jgi:hypothetical protein